MNAYPVICRVMENATTQFWYVKLHIGRRIRFPSKEAADQYADLLNNTLNTPWGLVA